MWIHAIADFTIAFSYIGIPLSFVVLRWAGFQPFAFLATRLQFGWVLFPIFILFCGWTHFWDAMTVWSPHYWWLAWLKLATSAVSLVTLWYLITTMHRTRVRVKPKAKT